VEYVLAELNLLTQALQQISIRPCCHSPMSKWKLFEPRSIHACIGKGAESASDSRSHFTMDAPELIRF
jgi:hypothetical protein